MKTRIIIAYEPESSQTMRLTPEDYGTLMQNVPDKELDVVLERMVGDALLYGTADRCAKLRAAMTKAAGAIR